jgi:hypothetical protein
MSHFYLLKKSAEVLLYFGWIADGWFSSCILLTSRKAFLYKAAQNFEVFSNIQN